MRARTSADSSSTTKPKATATNKGKGKATASSKPKPKPKPTAKSKGKAPARRSRTTPPAIRAAFLEYASPGSDIEDADNAPIDALTITVPDVRRALRALGYPMPPADFFEDDNEGLAWREFAELAETMGEGVDGGGDDEDGSDGEGSEYAGDEGHEEMDVDDDEEDDEQKHEIDEAFRLFFPRGGERMEMGLQGGGPEPRITIADLRRIARELKEDVDDDVLRLMLEEATGDGGKEGLRRGVGRMEFEGVMRRAGVFK